MMKACNMLALVSGILATGAQSKNIVELAVGSPDLSTLVTALKAADLVTALEADGPFTVFAPTNEAFGKIDADALSNLLADKDALTNVLTYHVAAGKYSSEQLLHMQYADTLQGGAVSVSYKHGVKIDDASVLTADVVASNGVVHIIDTVLTPPKDIVDLAVGSSDLSTLVTALQAADLVTTLQGKGPFTVFAPTTAAFGKIDADALANLLKDKDALTNVLTYHVAAGKLRAADLLHENPVATLQGSHVNVWLDWETFAIKVNNIEVLTPNVDAKNGVVHILDSVLMPPSHSVSMQSSDEQNIVDLAVGTPDLSTLVTALQAADLVTTLQGDGPFTVFAPTNEAFGKIDADALSHLLADKDALTNVLVYHVIAGRYHASDLLQMKNVETLQGGSVKATLSWHPFGVKIDDAMVLTANVQASNGVVHIIDTVLTPPKDIVDLSVGTADLSTLVTALQAADLVTTLQGKGPFTVFAPTNEAFGKIDADALANLLKDKAALTNVLTYHVSAGKLFSGDLLHAQHTATLQGGSVSVTLNYGTHPGVRVNDATVVTADVDAKNGVVHVIDTVLSPPARSSQVLMV